MINLLDSILKLFSFFSLVSISLTQICFGLLFLLILFMYFKKEVKLNLFDKKLIFLFAIFFGLYMLSVIVNYSAFPSFNKLVSKLFGWWHYLIFFITSIASYRLLDYKKDNHFTFLYLGAFFASIYGIYQILILYFSRAEGFFSHALTYGNALAIILILVYVHLAAKFHWKYVILTITIGLGLLLSLSRGPILSFLLTVFVLNILIMKYKGLILNIIGVILLSLIVSNSSTLKNRFDDFVNNSWKNTTSSFGTRVVLWKTSIDIIKDYPVFGIGYDIKKEFKKRIKVPVSSTAHSHNSYLTLAVYRGIPTVIILLLIYLYFFKIFYYSNDNVIKYSGIGVLLVYLLEGLTENNFGDSEVLMIFWLVMGLLFSYSHRDNKSPN